MAEEVETTAFLDESKDLDSSSTSPQLSPVPGEGKLCKGGLRVATLFLAAATLFFLIAFTKDGDRIDRSAADADARPSSALSISTSKSEISNSKGKEHVYVKGDKYGKDMARLSDARKLALQSIKEMEQDYGEDARAILNSMAFYNRDYIKRKLARAVIEPGGDFIIAFAGTSVTAGHDNYFWQSYPMILQKEANTSFAAAGVNFIVRNHAMGNNPPLPPAFCVGSQLGPDADVVVWEFGMMVGGEQQAAVTEQWIRNGIAQAKQPAIMILDPGEGARKPDGEGKLPTTPRTGNSGNYIDGFVHHPTNTPLARYYEDFGVHGQAMEKAVWTLDWKDRYNFKALVDSEKPGPGVSWHPGPGGHRLRGRLLAYNYLRLLDEAISDAYFAMEQDDLEGTRTVKELLKLEHHDIPPAVACHKDICEHPSSCAMTMQPRAQNWLVEYVESPKDISKEQTLEAQDNGKWHVQLFETDTDAVHTSIENNYHYLDLKYVLQGNKDAGPITFAIESKEKGYIFICQPPGLWGHLPGKCGDFREHAEFRIDGQLKKWAPEEFYNERSINWPTCFTTPEMFAPGKHKVELKPIDPDGKYCAVSALVWY